MTTQKHQFDATGDLARVTIETVAPAARFSLRVRPAQAGALGKAMKLDLPDRIGAVARKDDIEVACLGPDEWLVVAPEARREALIAASGAAYAKAPHAFCEVSDREITLRLGGPEALTILTTGIARDVGAMEVGRAVRTAFDSATVILWRDAEDSFRMDVWRSFLPHVNALLSLARTEIAAGL